MRFTHQLKLFCLRRRYGTDTLLVKDIARLEKSIKDVLRDVIEPISNRSIVSIGSLCGITAIPGKFQVKLDLDLFVPGHPKEFQIHHECSQRIKAAFEWAKEVIITSPKKSGGLYAGQNSKVACLSRVEHIVLVSSCKGGVGKSTVSVNLATTLAKRGLKVALLDADIYGPSLPLMLTPLDPIVRKVPEKAGFVKPLLTKEGIKFLSFGHVNPKSATGAGGKGAAVMRGPIATRVINQLIAATEWGDVDYLIVDMPPGTGDIQITVTQTLAISGAVLVTTPHPLSLADSAKGIAMFEDMKIKPLAIVENMSYFECDAGKIYYPFGYGGRENFIKSFEKSWENDAQGRSEKGQEIHRSLEMLKQAPMHKIPLSSSAALEDQNSKELIAPPLVLRDSQSKISSIYSALADDVIQEILRQQLDAQIIPSITYSESRGGIVLRYFEASKVSEYIIPTSELRTRDAKTGKPTSRSSKDFANIKPINFDFKGNYGVAIQWSDGHYADIFPFDVLKDIADELRL